MKFTPWRKKFILKRGLIYVILDSLVIKSAGLDVFFLTNKLTSCGVDIFQLRSKNISDQYFLSQAAALAKIIHKRKKIFIVNDRADIALLSKADGVHLGKDDISPQSARKILGNDKIIGKTTHSWGEFCSFRDQDTDYLSIGPIFKTKTKPLLKCLDAAQRDRIIKNSQKPIFAIGGINLSNLKDVLSMGIKNIALCRGLVLRDDFQPAVKKFKVCLKKVF